MDRILNALTFKTRVNRTDDAAFHWVTRTVYLNLSMATPYMAGAFLGGKKEARARSSAPI